MEKTTEVSTFLQRFYRISLLFSYSFTIFNSVVVRVVLDFFALFNGCGVCVRKCACESWLAELGVRVTTP